jgi:hypothetical protein
MGENYPKDMSSFNSSKLTYGANSIFLDKKVSFKGNLASHPIPDHKISDETRFRKS